MCYDRPMRFGSRRHDVDPEPDAIDTKLKGQRDQLVKLLRDLADRIEHAPLGRITDSLTWLAGAVEPMARVVERALSRQARKG